ncbi:MAG TPA: hypothetical protein VEN47_01040 [Myxococcota bacterium]|nr:hypothetical protein [Myxococcota bacterium]
MPNAKGTVMVGLVKALRREKSRARELMPPQLAHYLDERIVLASWYPLEDFLALLRLTAKVARSGSGRVFEERGRIAAREHMTGAYNRLSQTTHRRATFTLLASMFDSGRTEVVDRKPGSAVLEFSDFALPSRELCEIFTGYNAERMALLGFEEVRVRHAQCRVDGAPTCRWEIAWKGRETL